MGKQQELTTDHENRLRCVEERASSAINRLNNFDKQTEAIQQMGKNVAVLAVEIKNNTKVLEQQIKKSEKQDIKIECNTQGINELKGIPGKKALGAWNRVLTILLSILSGVAISVIAAIALGKI